MVQEIQLLKPDKFDNIFVSMGAFHTGKPLLTSVTKFLEGSGAEKVLAETETLDLYGDQQLPLKKVIIKESNL